MYPRPVRRTVVSCAATGHMVGGGCSASSQAVEWTIIATAECGAVDEDGEEIPGTRKLCSASGDPHRREGSGNPADVISIDPQEVALSVDLVPDPGEVVLPGTLRVEVGVSARAWGPATRTLRWDLGGTVTSMEVAGLAG